MHDLVTAAIMTAAISSLLAGPSAEAAEPERPVVVFVARDGDPHADELWLAIEAHLNGIPVSVRRVAVEAGGDPTATAREEIASGRAAAAIWISETADAFFFADAPFSDAPEATPIPDTGEGWPSRCALVGSLIVPHAEALAARRPDPAPEPAPQPEPAPAPAPAPAAPLPTEPAPAEPAPATPPAARGAGLSVTPRIGVAIPTSRLDPFVIVGLNIDVALPPLDRRISLALDTTYTRPSRKGDVRDAAVAAVEVEYEVQATEVKWALDVMWRFYDSGRRVAAFVGCGPVAQLVVARERTSLGAGDNTVRTLAAGGEIAFFFEWRAGLGGVTFDARYAYTHLDTALLGDTNAGNATAALGYRFEF